MNKCYTIQVLDDLSLTDNYKDSNGILYLDTYGEESIIEKKSRATLSESGKIKIDGALNIDVPYSEKNNIILSTRIGSNLENVSDSPFSIIVWQSGDILPYNYMVVVSKSDKSRSYTISLENRMDHPLSIASNFKINNIPYFAHEAVFNGFINPKIDQPVYFSLNNEDIRDRWVNGWKYEDGGDGWFPAPVWYGGIYNNGILSAQDIRPLVSPLWLLRKGFGAMGWSFRSTTLESDKWRSAWCYLADDKYGGNNIDELEAYEFLGRVTSAKIEDIVEGGVGYYSQGKFVANGRVSLDIIKDADGDYNGVVTGANFRDKFLRQELIVEYSFESEPTTNPVTSQIKLNILSVKEFGLLGQTSFYLDKEIHAEEVIDIDKDEKSTYTGSINAIVEESTSVGFSSTSYFLEIEGLGDISASIKFYNKPERITYKSSQGAASLFSYPLSETLSRDISLLDVLKGILHMTGGILEYDFGNQIITHYTPDEYKDGSSLVDITDKVICDSANWSAQKSDQSRFLIYGYNSANDAFIRFKDANGENQVFDKKIDLGERFDNKTKKNRNPIFEPTLLRNCPEVVKSEAELGFPPKLPALTDNNSGSVSYNINPRILFSSPPSTQVILDADGEVIGSAKMNWGDSEEISSFPLLHLEIPSDISLNSGQQWEYRPMVYGEGAGDFWNTNIGAQVLQEETGQPVSVEAYLPLHVYDQMSLRNIYTLMYKSEYIQAFIKDISYDRCTGLAEILLQSVEDTDSGVIDTTVLTTPEDEAEVNCGNKPRLDIVESSGTYTISVVGVFTSNITSVVWKLNYAYNVLSPTSIEVVNPTTNIYLKAVVNFDGDCPAKGLSKSILVCANRPSVQIEDYIKDGVSCVYVKIVGVISSPIASITASVSYNNKTEAYTVNPNTLFGDTICDVATDFVLNSLTINYQGDCESFTITDQVVLLNAVKRVGADCEQTTAGVEVVDSMFGFKTINKTGNIASPRHIDTVWIFVDGEDPKIWDGTDIPASVGFQVMRKIEFCDNECPPHISCWEEHLAECDCSNITDSSLYIECVDNTLKPVWSGLSCELPSDVVFSWKDSLDAVVSNDEEYVNPATDTYTLEVTSASLSCTKVSEESYNFVKPEAGDGGNVAVEEDDM